MALKCSPLLSCSAPPWLLTQTCQLCTAGCAVPVMQHRCFSGLNSPFQHKKHNTASESHFAPGIQLLALMDEAGSDGLGTGGKGDTDNITKT